MGRGAKVRVRGLNLTGRAAVLVVVVMVVLAMLAYPARAYVEQRRDIHQLKEQAAASVARQQRLTNEIERFNDQDFVAQKAAELGYVQPGQRRYVLAPSGEQSEAATSPSQQVLDDQNAALLSRPLTQQQWYDRVVESLARPGKPLPAQR